MRLLRGLLWGQHYRHSNHQCEGGMPRSFELREDMGEDQVRALEDWLLVEGYAYRFRRKRWRGWTRPDRPGEGLRPDGIEADEKPNEYPSGATINVSMWDMIGKEFPELKNERRLQGSSSSSHTSLGDFLEVARQAKTKPRPLLLRKSGPSSDVGSTHRRRRPADQASSSSSVPSDQRGMARACERACGVPCNLRVARQRATQQNAAVEGAIAIAQHEAGDWGRGVDFHASAVAAYAARVTAAAAHEAAHAQVKGEVAAAAGEARLTQEAIACKEAEVKALGEALAQEWAKTEAEERAHAEATAKAQAEAARKDTMEAARQKVAEERAGKRPKGELPQPRTPQWRRRRPSSAARLPREDPQWRPFEDGAGSGGGGHGQQWEQWPDCLPTEEG